MQCVSSSAVFFHIYHERHGFKKKKLLNIKLLFLFSLQPFLWNISHSTKSWVRYDQKCKLVFMQNTRYPCLILMKLEFSRHIFKNTHHHHVPEGLAVFPVPWSSRWSWSLHLFLGRPMFLRPFGLYCGAYFGSLFVSILCTCCSHFFWYCFISFTMFCAPVFCLIHWFFSLSSFVIPSKCLKNFIYAASKRCSSLF